MPARRPRTVLSLWLAVGCSLLIPLTGCRSDAPTQAETLQVLIAGQCAYDSVCGTAAQLATCQSQLQLGWWGDVPQPAPITTSTVTELDYPVAVGNLSSQEALLAAFNAGEVLLDNAQAASCLIGINAEPCTVPLSAETLHACASMYVGTIPVGGSCIASPSCVLGSTCMPMAGDEDVCAATCQPLAPGTCESALHCAADEICASGKCAPIVPPGSAGEPCGNQIQCGRGLLCESTVCEEGELVSRCEQPVQTGGTCQEYGACGETVWYSNGDCNSEAWCVGVTNGKGTCVEPLRLGAHCTIIDECRGGYCSSGTCVPFPSSGPCSPPPLYGCSGGNYCDQSGPTKCLPLKSAGMPCTSNRQCQSPLVCLNPGNGGTVCAPAPTPEHMTCASP